MKKKLFVTSTIICILITIFLLIYYNKYRNNTMICTYSTTADVYAMQTKYIVKYKNGIVSNISTEEIFTKNDEETLKEYKSTLESMYMPYSNLKYYEYSVTIKDNQVISKTNINYKKLDFKKFIEIDSSNKDIITNNKVTIKKVKQIYKNNGARCVLR